MKKSNWKWIGAALSAVVLFVIYAAGKGAGSMEEVLTVTLLKVGKADAIVLQSGENCMVIDTGRDKNGEEVADFLEERGVSRIDTLIITHFDKDHVGGADTLVEEIEIGQVLVPDYESDSTQYLEFIAALENKGLVPERLTEAKQFSFGTAAVLVEPPQSYEAAEGETEIDNNLSLITTVTHGSNRLLFTGDIEEKRIKEWVQGGTAQTCDFIKMPHHGRYDAALPELLEAVQPKYAAICSSQKRPAKEKTLKLLEKYGVAVWQTKDGDITVVSDGSRLEVTQ